MKKVMLFFMLGVFTLGSSGFKTANLETKAVQSDICDYEANMAWALTFVSTGDFWLAESAALTAESECEDRTGLEEWLEGVE
jgi:hypothetical protein